MNNSPLEWYLDIPVVSRTYMTLCVLTTALCALDVINPLSLYYNYTLITEKGQYWRLFTTFLYFGNFSIDFMFHLYFSVRYCRLLEENSFRGRTLDFIFLLGYGMISILLIAPFNFVNLPFLGSSLTFMLVYIWGRRNPHVRMSFLGLFQFTANYLAYILLGFSMVLGNKVAVDVIGICVGHIYFYFDDIYPEVARIRRWKQRHFLRAPGWLKSLFINEIIVATNQNNNPDEGIFLDPIPMEQVEARNHNANIEPEVEQQNSAVIGRPNDGTNNQSSVEIQPLPSPDPECVVLDPPANENPKIDANTNMPDPEVPSMNATLKELFEARLRRRRQQQSDEVGKQSGRSESTDINN